MGTGNQRKYAARAKEWALGETAKGGEEVVVHFEILTPDAEMSAINWYGYFTDKTWERTIESLRICGWTGADLQSLDGLNANEVELVIEDEEYEGKMRARVRWVNRPGGLSLKAPLSGDRAKSFAASMRDRIKALDATSPQRPAPRTQPAMAPPPHIGQNGGAPPLTDDDIPF